ncbi:FAD-dependent oxidoreductase [Mycolicibacterium sp. J2]|uniref:FAD-dependent oxidoreductase n=1 Tax=Mycolicibacterium sp. J2 TaxID=2993511 RepID=UPI00224B25C7|nr:FAD-dependent oxidoreductase [Mycolicibacterium sp. J2]MCX2715416.1 FAD-dependent oxidoreductase [Mycolicibacterium sp. J2]
MAFVITQNCCTDASCVPVCPVDCIRPVPGPSGAAAPMLYIDPATCVDCGACVAVCPVGAIYHEDDVPASQQRFTEINAAYFAARPLSMRAAPPKWSPGVVGRDMLRVAVVGAGPAACYAVADLARTSGVQVNVFDRLPTPFGLVRFGVAPDHQRTKDVTQVFETALAAPNVSCFFNVAVGQDISHDELMATHDAVIYAVGASESRELGIPGEELAGTVSAAAFVNWYNGHPDHADRRFDLTGPRVVIIGNGNVALDVARVLVTDRDRLAATDIAGHALDQLAAAGVREVVVVGRRGAGDGAFSVGELLALGTLPGVDVTVEGELGERPDDHECALKFDIVREYAQRTATPGSKRIVLRFGACPVRLDGDGRVSTVVLQDDSGLHGVDTSLVLTSIGYRGTPVPGLPFDAAAGIVPHDGGRVLRDGAVEPGVYVTGWIKRGPRGVIGTNRLCARETVTNLLADARAGLLPSPASDQRLTAATLAARGVEVVTLAGWHLIDAVERENGSAVSRPRVKVVDRRALLTAAGAGG